MRRRNGLCSFCAAGTGALETFRQPRGLKPASNGSRQLRILLKNQSCMTSCTKTPSITVVQHIWGYAGFCITNSENIESPKSSLCRHLSGVFCQGSTAFNKQLTAGASTSINIMLPYSENRYSIMHLKCTPNMTLGSWLVYASKNCCTSPLG